MSAFQEVAAIFGIAELSFRAIISLYDFVSSLKHVPKELERLKEETSSLNQSLSALQFLASVDSDTQDIVRRVGLAGAISSCGSACQSLEQELSKWAQSSARSVKLKVQFRLHKKAIDSVLAQIGLTKQTTILSVQLQQPMSTIRRDYVIAKAEERVSHESEIATYAQQRQRKSNIIVPIIRSVEITQLELDKMKSANRGPVASAKGSDEDPPQRPAAQPSQAPQRNETTKGKKSGIGEIQATSSSSQPAPGTVDQTFTNLKTGEGSKNRVGNSNMSHVQSVKQVFTDVDFAANTENIFANTNEPAEKPSTSKD